MAQKNDRLDQVILKKSEKKLLQIQKLEKSHLLEVQQLEEF